MSPKSIVSGLVSAAWLMVCATIAITLVIGFKWTLHSLWPQSSMLTGLLFGLIAPMGVLLFALLVEQLSSLWDDRETVSASVRYAQVRAK